MLLCSFLVMVEIMSNRPRVVPLSLSPSSEMWRKPSRKKNGCATSWGRGAHPQDLVWPFFHGGFLLHVHVLLALELSKRGSTCTYTRTRSLMSKYCYYITTLKAFVKCTFTAIPDFDIVSWTVICWTLNTYRWLPSPCEKMRTVCSKDLCL